MIVMIHKHNEVCSIIDYATKQEIKVTHKNPVYTLFLLCEKYPDTLLVWCHETLKEYIHEQGFHNIFHHKLVMASYEMREDHYISDRIGYVESSPYLNIKKNVTYPTWLMSSSIGGIYAKALHQLDFKAFKTENLDYVLNSVAKTAMNRGLFCYSAPSLLIPNDVKNEPNEGNVFTLFKFIKQHYKARWCFLLFLNYLLYEKKFQLPALIYSVFISKKRVFPNFKDIEVKSSRSPHNIKSIDVVIPTVGRKDYLYDVLHDLSNQTALPNQVIIIEQNPILNSQSDLDYLQTQSWPFKINHVFTHRTGACNARNLALTKVNSAFVFLADDDIKFDVDVLDKALKKMADYGLNAATLSCLRENELETKDVISQWPTFGSGCSIISSTMLEGIFYDLAFEHGFGEDGDFGMQIRNLGLDIGYLPDCKLLHLKAPVGGFRSKFNQPWENDAIQPKPSPTVMLFNLRHQTKYQLLGYKSLLFFKFYKLQPNKNAISYFSNMKKRWNQSIFWSNQLKSNHDI